MKKQHLALVLKKRKININDLTKLCKLSRPVISRICNGRQPARPHHRAAIAQALGLSVEAIRWPNVGASILTVEQQRLAQCVSDLEDVSQVGSELFAVICDAVWRGAHPETPEDGLRHTSDVCRRTAVRILGVLSQFFSSPVNSETSPANWKRESEN